MDESATRSVARSAADGCTGGRSLLVRALALAGSLAGGLAVGGAGYMASGNPYWFLAVPATLAAVWLFIGTPQDCACSEPLREPGSRG